ncbi:MAG TPA: response regulator [Gemmatimonadales bacterium]|nr:response regulator [Gemmatimonadales bacterium]
MRTSQTVWETILLVDDDEAVRRIAKRALSRSGYHVLEAAGGAEALDLYRRHGHAIRLLVTDVVMPEIGGVELVQRLCATEPDLRVLFISGHAEELVRRPDLMGRHQHFLRKPFTIEELTRMVRELLDTA